MLASLPMYDFPEVRGATNALWVALRVRLARQVQGLPLELERTQTRETHWRHPKLVFSQTCGYPLRLHFREHLRVLGAPRYSATGCAGHDYRSAIVVRDESRDCLEEFRGAVLAVNGIDSQSGYNVVKATLRSARLDTSASQPFFGCMKVTGTHRASIAMVQRADADIAAIDPVSLALVRTHAPQEFTGLKVIQHSPAAPSLPWVTSVHTSATIVSHLRRAIADTLADPLLVKTLSTLHLSGFDAVDMREYERIDSMTSTSATMVLAPEDLAAS